MINEKELSKELRKEANKKELSKRTKEKRLMKRNIIFFLIILLVLAALLLTGCDLLSKQQTSEEPKKSYVVTVIDGVGGGICEQDKNVLLVPGEVEGKVFSHWEIDGDKVSDDRYYHFRPQGDTTVVAVFVDKIARYSITTDESTKMSPNVPTGLGEYDEGSTVTLTAKSAPYLVFLYWTYNGEKAADTHIFTFTATENAEVVPVYNYYTPEIDFEYRARFDSYVVSGHNFSCNSYLYKVTIPEYYNDGSIGIKKVTGIDSEAFRSVKMSEVIVGDAVEKIGDGAFYGCSNLTKIKLPDSLQSIGERCFASCYNLTGITLPRNVADIAYNAFHGMSSLKEIIVDEKNSYFRHIDGVLYNKAGDTLLRYPQGKGEFDKDFEIPATVTGIGIDAFYFVYLKQLSFASGNGIKEIGQYAFADSKIGNVKLPDGITTIASHAFYSCTRLENINFAIINQLTTIGDYAFYDCTKLKISSLPADLRTIGSNAFENCTGLRGDTLRLKNLEKIGASAFKNTHLTTVYISGTVTQIGEDAFVDCDFLYTVYVALEGIIPQLSQTAFGGLIAKASSIFIIDRYTAELPAYIIENYAREGTGTTSYYSESFKKYIKKKI